MQVKWRPTQTQHSFPLTYNLLDRGVSHKSAWTRYLMCCTHCRNNHTLDSASVLVHTHKKSGTREFWPWEFYHNHHLQDKSETFPQPSGHIWLQSTSTHKIKVLLPRPWRQFLEQPSTVAYGLGLGSMVTHHVGPSQGVSSALGLGRAAIYNAGLGSAVAYLRPCFIGRYRQKCFWFEKTVRWVTWVSLTKREMNKWQAGLDSHHRVVFFSLFCEQFIFWCTDVWRSVSHSFFFFVF